MYSEKGVNCINFLVSIIIPVYNVESWLSRCIDSIISQTYDKLEIILIDDGSTDSSSQICDVYAMKDPRIKVIHKKNGGLSDARNIGIEQSSGEFLMFIDSDDYVEVNMVQILLDRIINDTSDLVICDLVMVDGFGKKVDGSFENLENEIITEKQFWNKLYNGMGVSMVVAWNKLYKRSLFDNTRYPLGKIHEDEFIIHYIVSQCERISIVGKKLYYYVQRNNSIMHQKFKLDRLHIVKGFAQRMDYFFDNGDIDFAWKTLSSMRGILGEAYLNLNLKENSNYIAFTKARKVYLEYVKKCCRIQIQWKYFIKNVVFILNIKLYYLLKRKKWKKYNEEFRII